MQLLEFETTNMVMSVWLTIPRVIRRLRVGEKNT
jgi:hypothetical protein